MMEIGRRKGRFLFGCAVFGMRKFLLSFASTVMLIIIVSSSIGGGFIAKAAKLDTAEFADKLGEAFGISKSDLDNYHSNYSKSLPMEYKQVEDSVFVVLGGATASGTVAIPDSYLCYGDLLAAEWDIEYDNRATNSLRSSDLVTYINRQKNAISKADLITLEIDGSSLLTNAMTRMAQTSVNNWGKYVDEDFEQFLKDVEEQIIAEYEEEYGKKNAESIADVLEYLLYECIVYGVETVNAVNKIREFSSDASILVIGLYNPVYNLCLSSNGQTIEIGDIIAEMFHICDVYLFTKTVKMEGVGFIDASEVETNGFGTVELDTSSSNALSYQLSQIANATDKQYANTDGHKRIKNLIMGALVEPCEHTQTKIVGEKPASCKSEGYSGDEVCSKCGKVLSVGEDIAKTAHSFSAWKETKAPSCVKKGEETRSCSVCSKKETRDIAVTDEHKLDDGKVTKKPDCDTRGEKTFSCTVDGCKYTKTEVIAALGHKMDDGVITKEPTCVVEGEKTFSCTACDQKETEVIPAGEHQYGEYASNGDATCENDGTKTAVCSICGEKDTIADQGSKKEHVFENGECVSCKAKQQVEDNKNEDGDNSFMVIAIVSVVGLAVVVGGIIFFVKKKK